MMTNGQGILVVVSGFSGAGKAKSIIWGESVWHLFYAGK